METKHKSAKVMLGLLVLVGMGVFSLLAVGGSLEPNSPPGPTMKTLDEIYEAVIGVSQREGHIINEYVPPSTTTDFLPVPPGKQFVLLKLYFESPHLVLMKDSEELVGSTYFQNVSNGSTCEDFPDRCIVVEAGKTLKVENAHSSGWHATIVGYFCDVP